MNVRDTVFGSKSERRLYATLNSHWSENFDLFPSLPFSTIIDFEKGKLSEKQKNFLYKTSVDYTLCTKEGKPIVSVEFDGLGHGFSKDGQYVEIVPSKDPNRKLKLDLKLGLCAELGYPLFIVSYDEAAPIGSDTNLTIVDGLIGQVLAKRNVTSLLQTAVNEHSDLLEDLPTREREELFQNMVIDAEVDAEMTWNPIYRSFARLECVAHRNGLWQGLSIYHLVDPPFPESKPTSSLFDIEALNGRIRALEDAVRLGCRVTLQTPKGEISEVAWVRNFEGYGLSLWSMAESIARLILFSKLILGT